MAFNEEMESSERERYAVAALLLILSLAVRLFWFSATTGDYVHFVSLWFGLLKVTPGYSAFAYQFSDYSPTYLYLLKLLTFVPVKGLYSVKALSTACDVLIALVVVRLYRRIYPAASKATLFLVGAILFSVPTITLNSSVWGQVDALYALGVMASLFFMIVESPLLAVMAFGFAFCVKLQSIFFLPVLVGWVLRKKYGLQMLLILPCMFICSIVPAWISGGSFDSLLYIYLYQGHENAQALTMFAPSIYAYAPSGIAFFHTHLVFLAGIFLAGLAALACAAALYLPKKPISPGFLLLVSLLCCVAVPFLLPRMHERYFYLADCISVTYACIFPRRWYLPVLIVGASLFSYFPYLSDAIPFFQAFIVPEWLLATMMAFALCILAVSVTKEFRRS